MRKRMIRLYEYFRRRLLYMRRRFVSPSIPKNQEGKILVNVGCGFDTSNEFINVDVLPLPHIHHVHDITDLSMFPSDSVDLLYASHVVEHIPVERLMATLKEWRRALKPGGTIRISVPDFDNMTDYYIDSGRDVDLVRDNVLGKEPPYDNHYTLWNERKMQAVLAEAGFTNHRRWTADSVEHHNFSDRSSRTLRIAGEEKLLSLNIEADKA